MKQFHGLGLAMTARKPAPLRWSEEAEANHVREWAELERGSPNQAASPEICLGPSRRPLYSFGLFSRLRILLRRHNSQIMQDG
jgi:hypothetical protein